MERVTLAVTKRESDGSRQARRVRRAGEVPAVLYGQGMKPLAISVVKRDLIKALLTKAGENVILDLNVQDLQLKESTCLIKDIQHNPVTDHISHVDFRIISLTDKIRVKVHIVVTHAEESEGVKQGGVLDLIHYEVEVECLPTAIPQKIEVNAKALKLGQAVHAHELVLPEGVVCQLPADEVIAAIHAPREEEAAATVEGAEAVQPEVIEKGKKDELKEGEAAAVPAPAAKTSK
ncbi:MAG: 50S ribosomal protein L25 [Candidatus Omnitrophica bacterium]|nr:50S ribosomal protein L25 [Candidatus Omnitrophota bacterium]